jgi:nuclear transport factor 2 (NTF2) superfamily protein
MKINLTTTALLALALSLLFAGCATAPKDPAKRSNPIVERAFAAWNSQDPDKLAAAYNDDIVYEDVPSGSLSNGRTELRKFAVLT